MVEREMIRESCNSVRRYAGKRRIADNVLLVGPRAFQENCPNPLELSIRVAERLALENVVRRFAVSSSVATSAHS